MTDRIVFAIFDEADEAYATRLAGAFAPMPLLPSPLGVAEGRKVRFGYGSLCVVLWTPALAARVDEVIAIVAEGADNALLCRLPGAATPPHQISRTLDLTGEFEADAKTLKAALDALPPRSRVREGTRHAPRLGANASVSGPVLIKSPDRRRRFLARSAFGLAVTFVVVATATHWLSRRMAAPSGEVAAAAPASGTVADLPPAAPEIAAAPPEAVAQPPMRRDVAPAAPAAVLQPTPVAPVEAAPTAEDGAMEPAEHAPSAAEGDAASAPDNADTGENSGAGGQEAETMAGTGDSAVIVEGPSL